jgi:hypothetical protein
MNLAEMVDSGIKGNLQLSSDKNFTSGYKGSAPSLTNFGRIASVFDTAEGVEAHKV